jgi:predicted peroxiredoxin
MSAGFLIKSLGDPAKDINPPATCREASQHQSTSEDTTMQTGTDKLVILMTKGIDSELSSVAFTIANGGITAGLKVSVFLTSSAVDIVRRGGQRLTHVSPLDPLTKSIEDFQKRGGVVWARTPCVQSRGYQQSDLLEGVTITGASVVHAQIKEGTAALSF